MVVKKPTVKLVKKPTNPYQTITGQGPIKLAPIIDKNDPAIDFLMTNQASEGNGEKIFQAMQQLEDVVINQRSDQHAGGIFAPQQPLQVKLESLRRGSFQDYDTRRAKGVQSMLSPQLPHKLTQQNLKDFQLFGQRQS